MRSTGEVMGIATNDAVAFGKSLLSSGFTLPKGGRVFISVKDADKVDACHVARRLRNLGFSILATKGTATVLKKARIPCEVISKIGEGSPHVVDAISAGTVQILINTTHGTAAVRDSYAIRRNALLANIPYFTTMSAAQAAVSALEAYALAGAHPAPEVRSVQEWHARSVE
jgi:carbamoyl-phosphate synthase large subunit